MCEVRGGAVPEEHDDHLVALARAELLLPDLSETETQDALEPERPPMRVVPRTYQSEIRQEIEGGMALVAYVVMAILLASVFLVGVVLGAAL